MEIWKDIKGFEGIYAVSTYGRVKSVERDVVCMWKGKQVIKHFKEKILKPSEITGGHLQVILCKSGVEKPKKVHQLVAQTFIPNPHGYAVVHHKNHNPQDNRVKNLEWIGRDEHYAIHLNDRIEGAKEALSKRVDQIDSKTGEVLRQWDRAMDAVRELGYDKTSISKCSNSKQKTAYKCLWKYPML